MKEIKNNKQSRMPVLFIGHGNPMNAIEKNEFSDTWRAMGLSLPRPEAILCISAHWETNGTKVTAMPLPKTIHDFGGFPQALFDVQYPAPGNPNLAKDIVEHSGSFNIEPDLSWGLDHGCWSVVRCMYPAADIPVVQLSLDWNLSPAQHYQLAKELLPLREKGVLIVGSGNIVHNLHKIEWENQGGAAWAIAANATIKQRIVSGDHQALVNYAGLGKEVGLAVNSAEHFLPLLYVLALKQVDEKLSLFNDKLVMGSLAMTSVLVEGV